MDDPTRHDSTAVVEIIGKGLERVACICQNRGVSMPSKVIVFGDNTVRELKNQYCFDYMMNIVGKRKMRLFGAFFLRKSHTHDRIDQLWGVLARRISNCDSILHAEDTINIIKEELSRPGVRAWLGSTTELHVQKLDACRDWKSMWKTQGISLKGGLLEDTSANHVFLFLQRKGWYWVGKAKYKFYTLNYKLYTLHPEIVYTLRSARDALQQCASRELPRRPRWR